MLINLDSLTKFGNLTKGGGLSAAFDGNSSTVAYADYPSGYLGVTLDSPKRIHKAEVYSADNGFDASGVVSEITLLLYGKNGLPPSHALDGVVLSTVSFSDQNLTRSVTLESSNKYTEFEHVWIRIVTGVWSIVSEVRLYESQDQEPVSAPENLDPGFHVCTKSCDESVALSHGGSEIDQFRILLPLLEARSVAIDFHGCVVHTGVGIDSSVAVGFSFRVCHRSSDTYLGLMSEKFTERPNSANGGNVINRNPHHYGNASITDAIQLPAGFSEISIIGSGHTDGSTTQGLIRMLVEGGRGLNCLRAIVLP